MSPRFLGRSLRFRNLDRYSTSELPEGRWSLRLTNGQGPGVAIAEHHREIAVVARGQRLIIARDALQGRRAGRPVSILFFRGIDCPRRVLDLALRRGR